MRIGSFERNKRLKFIITLGMIAPAMARAVAPDSAELISLANAATLVAGLMWLWEM